VAHSNMGVGQVIVRVVVRVGVGVQVWTATLAK